MERGLVLSVVLILAAAMFAGNLNSDDSVTGMQSNEEIKGWVECVADCIDARDTAKMECTDKFNDDVEKLDIKKEECEYSGYNDYEVCLESNNEKICDAELYTALARCDKFYGPRSKRRAVLESVRNDCYNDADKIYESCALYCLYAVK
ncbi:hypothetical protein HN992_02340 [Candidatus Woesearchaeota archaeon]|jgi:hypothetical protein|nr:hypothetical protein [Candidatus Woesearchaeota archaeon]MBT4057941.1 hypothetical protein [Candidatus Woesearchaeota archaeon]MBT4730888.1 hypothetical protein [Candidatus Woesearchaeota archaeon]MBT4783381.1 hypothetical protein [Candidatus Woesearchaeota archaeon]MBT5111945.1 hypothetical protein [Candidatus Woesearchaeota archaeon]